MTTQTSLVAEQVRLQQWAEQVRDCKNRPRGMDVETWCAQNNITKDSIPAIRIKTKEGVSFEVFSNVSTEVLKYLIEVVIHAE